MRRVGQLECRRLRLRRGKERECANKRTDREFRCHGTPPRYNATALMFSKTNVAINLTRLGRKMNLCEFIVARLDHQLVGPKNVFLVWRFPWAR